LCSKTFKTNSFYISVFLNCSPPILLNFLTKLSCGRISCYFKTCSTGFFHVLFVFFWKIYLLFLNHGPLSIYFIAWTITHSHNNVASLCVYFLNFFLLFYLIQSVSIIPIIHQLCSQQVWNRYYKVYTMYLHGRLFCTDMNR